MQAARLCPPGHNPFLLVATENMVACGQPCGLGPGAASSKELCFEAVLCDSLTVFAWPIYLRCGQCVMGYGDAASKALQVLW